MAVRIFWFVYHMQAEKYGLASAENVTPAPCPQTAHGTLQTQDESVIVGYYTSAEVLFRK